MISPSPQVGFLTAISEELKYTPAFVRDQHSRDTAKSPTILSPLIASMVPGRTVRRTSERPIGLVSPFQQVIVRLYRDTPHVPIRLSFARRLFACCTVGKPSSGRTIQSLAAAHQNSPTVRRGKAIALLYGKDRGCAGGQIWTSASVLPVIGLNPKL